MVNRPRLRQRAFVALRERRELFQLLLELMAPFSKHLCAGSEQARVAEIEGAVDEVVQDLDVALQVSGIGFLHSSRCAASQKPNTLRSA